MTIDQCHEQILAVRRQQGTRFPRLRIDNGGQVLKGTLARCDADPEHRARLSGHSGRLALQPVGAPRGTLVEVPIDELPPQSIAPLDDLA